jgi:5-deoxy-glucuronate isomerase
MEQKISNLSNNKNGHSSKKSPDNKKWVFTDGQTSDGTWKNIIDFTTPNWKWTGLKTGDIKNGVEIKFNTKNSEQICVPLFGGFEISVDNKIIKLNGRNNPFDTATDCVYIGPESNVVIKGNGKIALCGAFANPKIKLPSPVYIPVEKVDVSIKGSGNMSRVIRNFGTPDVLEAQNIIACEGYIPGGNWGSYPPHKHDTELKGIETQLEEIYYIEIRTDKTIIDPVRALPHGYHRVSNSDNRDIDVLSEIHSGDIVLVPFGWHGPSMAAPGYDMYFLNSMAGHGRERLWQITNHPDHKWLIDLWKKIPVDSRLKNVKESKKWKI